MKAESIAKIARKQLKTLGADKFDSQVNLTPKHDGSAHIEDLPDGKYRYIYSERGSLYNESITDNPQDILFWIYKDATFSMASSWELQNRIAGQDSRILLFKKQLELLRILGEEFAKREETEINNILKEYPYR